MNTLHDSKSNRTADTEGILDNLLIRDVIDDLEMEHAFGWILKRLHDDKVSSEPVHMYKTSLFSFYVNYGEGTVFISSELGGCHPPDQSFPLVYFYKLLVEECPFRDPDPPKRRKAVGASFAEEEK